MASRATVSVRAVDGSASGASLPLPAVLTAPIRSDVVQITYTNMAKNKRQPYAVSTKAGHQTSAESWGTGRAVARIPRVGGSGTSRAGQAAFGNMARGGHMFAPTKLWRRWWVKTNQNQKRLATASALAATAVPSLVLARGHRVEQVAEVPLVVPTEVESYTKTKEAVALLKAINAYDDVLKVSNSRKIRAGQGKLRNRRHVQRRGPLVVYNKDEGIYRAFRNLPGVELVSVHRLNLLQLAPGGHLGRFVIWTQAAFEQLDSIFGTFDAASSVKKGFSLTGAKITNTDVFNLIQSEQIQAAVNPAKGLAITKPNKLHKKNPLRNKSAMDALNPYRKVQRELEASIALAKKNGSFKPAAKPAKIPLNPKFLEFLHAP